LIFSAAVLCELSVKILKPNRRERRENSAKEQKEPRKGQKRGEIDGS
jgi:hypothetical protein